MIRIVYEPNEVWISGNPDQLRNVRCLILDFLDSSDTRLLIPGATRFDPSPYGKIGSGLLIQRGDGPIKIDLARDTVRIVGSVPNLVLFAERFSFSDDQFHGYHHHFEYYEGCDFIFRGSIPLVISVDNPDHGRLPST